MSWRNLKVIAGVGYGVVFIGVIAYLTRHGLALFMARGPVALAERNLIIITLLLSLIVVIPVFVLLFAFAWRYREGNERANYTPDWDHNVAFETVWWLLPLALIVVLADITWKSTHELDPARPIASTVPALTVQVVSLDWKWLFIYPDQHVATVNYLMIPTDRPVHFILTSDAPMNSFWVPQLGGQIYTMPGMSTQLNLMSTRDGDYIGRSANISGLGFSKMTFTVESRSNEDFSTWTGSLASTTSQQLTGSTYALLTKPSVGVATKSYSSVDSSLYDSIVAKYMPARTNAMSGMMMQ